LTNKTIDANGTGNSISNIEVADFAAGAIDTDLATVSASDDTLPSAKAVKAYIDAQNTAQAITFVGDDSTGTSVNSGETFKIAGTSNITTAVSGDTLTITGSKNIDVNSISSTDSTAIQINDGINVSGTVTANSGLVANGITYPTTDGTANQVLVTNGSGTLSFTSLNSFAGITFVGDDSSGSTINTAETLKFTGATGITTSVVGDVVTITGPNLSSYLTNSTTTIVGDDSTGTTLNSGETIKFAGATGITTSVTGDTLTITGPDLSAYLTAVPKTIDINQISSGDSTAIQINDAVNILGTLSMNGNAITQLANPSAQQDAATKAYVDSAVSAASTSFLVADDTSTVTTIDSGSTFQIVGAGSVTTSLSGDTITITGAGGATNYTFIGDDSTGTTLAGGSTLQVLGGEGISTAVIGNVLTITNTSTQMEIDGGSAYSIYNSVSEVEIDGGNA
jgi:adhesin/invasin